jgi:hypothetical protein
MEDLESYCELFALERDIMEKACKGHLTVHHIGKGNCAAKES